MIANSYTDEIVLKQLREAFEKEGSVHLTQFLDKKVHEKLLAQVKRAYFKRTFAPLTHSYGVLPFHQNLLARTVHDFICSLLGLTLPLPSISAYSFGHRDYTVLQDDVFEKKGILVQLDLSLHWKEEFGGSTYLIDKDHDFLRVLPLSNSLVMMKTDQTMKRFVKYVNHMATNRRRLFLEWFYPLEKKELSDLREL